MNKISISKFFLDLSGEMGVEGAGWPPIAFDFKKGTSPFDFQSNETLPKFLQLLLHEVTWSKRLNKEINYT